MGLSIRGAFAMVAAMVALGGARVAPVEAQTQPPAEPGDDDDAAAGEPAAAPAKEGIEAGGFDDYQTAEDRKKARVAVEYGVGLRFRTVFVPKPVLELFVDKASGGVFKPGIGLELTRRKGNFELVLGLEWENVSPKNGFWLDKGDDPSVPAETPDFIEFNSLAWVTADLAFLFSAAMTEQLAFRYGAGLGIGVVTGEILQTDSLCEPGTNAGNIQQNCMENPNAAQINEPADLPPVFPVVDLVIGLQWKPIDKLTLNLETGIRTLAFFGLSSTYY